VVRRVAYRKAAVKVALLYPSAYQVAMSSAVYHMLYFKLQDEGFYVERFTADRGPRGLEDGTPLSHFDYVVATVHYELDYVNLVKMLIDAGIPPRAADRRRPKLVVGGPPVVANPEPLAEFADAAAVGELESLWGPLVQYLATGDEAEGLYYPARGPHPVEVKYAKHVEPDYRRMPEPEAAFSLAVELARGCPYSCLFCMESYVTKPYRPRDWRVVLDEAERLRSKYGVRPSIVALTANAHPGFKELLAEAARRGLRLSLPSMRAELLDEEAVELLAAVGQRTLTIAPETSERLRRALGKEITDEDVLRVAKKAGELGMRLKLYLMVGLPCERPADLEEVTSLMKEVRKVAGAVSLSVNPFIPKPQTPLQYSPMASLAYLKEKIEHLRRAHRGDFSSYDPVLGAVQAAISLGGRDVARHIEAAATSPQGYWRRALREGLFDYIFKPREDPLPWGHVKAFYPPEELRRRYLKYLEEACG
jgi:radical SAM superfamily enzyme YgiQ (UPF0313 family)